MTTEKPDAADIDALDLSIRARRGDASPAENRLFADALEGSAWLETAHETGRSFDVEAQVRAGDEALIARAAASVLARGKLRAPLIRRRAPALVAVLVLASTAAAAGVVVVRHVKSRAPVAASNAAQTTFATGRRVQAVGVTTAPLQPGERDSQSPAEGTASLAQSNSTPRPETGTAAAPTRVVPPPDTSSRGAATEKDAASLFRDASNARRAGDFTRAHALYMELQQRFPGTGEARISKVSLGKLLLGQGRAREAEAQFKAYSASGGGDLEEEALVGRAAALAVLGELGEERRVWQELLRKYPASVYRARALERGQQVAAPASHR